MNDTDSITVVQKDIGEYDDDKPPPDLRPVSRGWAIRMVSGFISYVVDNQTKQTISSIDSLYRKFSGTFGIQDIY